MRSFLSLALLSLFSGSTAWAQGSGIRVSLHSRIADAIAINVTYSGNQTGTATWHYRGIWTDSTSPSGSVAVIQQDDSMQCALFNSPLIPASEFATFRLDTANHMLRGLRITSNGSGIPVNGIYAMNYYTIDFGDLPIASNSPGHLSVPSGNRTVRLQQSAYISNSLISPGTMVNGYSTLDTEIVDSGFSLDFSPAASARVAASDIDHHFTFSNGSFLFQPTAEPRTLTLYDIGGRIQAQLPIAGGVSEIPLPPLPAHGGLYIARLGEESIKLWVH